MLKIKKVDFADRADFREMVEAHWQDLMPRAIVVRGPGQRKAHFQEQSA